MQSSTNSSASKILLQLRREILDDWEKKVKKEIPSAARMDHPVLINTMPSFLENLADALSDNPTRSLATDGSTIAQEHGGERARLSFYDPEHLLKEYQYLRNTILETLASKIALTNRERNVILRSFDKAMQESVAAFALVHIRLREQFVASLSHDMRNPLGAAKMAADLIQSSASEISSEETRKDIENLAQRVLNNIKRVDRMIQDLLDASVLRAGERIHLNFTECDFFLIIKEVIADLERHQRVRIHVSGSPVMGFWDGEALRRAIENLINNAFKYGSPDSQVHITINSGDGRVRFCVHNRGSYIPMEEQETIFQPFRRSLAAQTGSKKGWGVGLAFVRGVSEGHGGSIGVDSSPDSGTTFLVDLPLDSRPFSNAPSTEPWSEN